MNVRMTSTSKSFLVTAFETDRWSRAGGSPDATLEEKRKDLRSDVFRLILNDFEELRNRIPIGHRRAVIVDFLSTAWPSINNSRAPPRCSSKDRRRGSHRSFC